jgi:hypothetical protein
VTGSSMVNITATCLSKSRAKNTSPIRKSLKNWELAVRHCGDGGKRGGYLSASDTGLAKFSSRLERSPPNVASDCDAAIETTSGFPSAKFSSFGGSVKETVTHSEVIPAGASASGRENGLRECGACVRDHAAPRQTAGLHGTGAQHRNRHRLQTRFSPRTSLTSVIPS